MARRWKRLPSELIGLNGWRAYLWNQALDWFERWDAGRAAAEQEQQQKLAKMIGM